MVKVYGCPFLPEGVRMYEQRAVLAIKLGRALAAKEVAHHKNGKKRDNRPRNLELKLTGKHVADHLKEWYAAASDAQRRERNENISRAKAGKPQPWARENVIKLRGIKRSAKFKQKVSSGMRKYLEEHPGELQRRAALVNERRTKRTHCKNGHELSPKNTFCGDGVRCKTCHREYKKAKRKKGK